METSFDVLGVETLGTEVAGRWDTGEVRRARPKRAARRKRATRGRPYTGRATTRLSLTHAATEVSDESLLAQLRAGDVLAGQALVERYHQPLLRYLQRTAGPRFAEDLHQQTWLSILSHLDRFVPSAEGGGSFRGWLFRIATNKTKDHWRSLTREKAAKEGLARISAGETSPWSGHAADSAEQQEKLRQAIEQLPDGQRTVLMLRYYSNLKFIDIAKLLGCPVNTALTRAHKGLLKLRVVMGQEAPHAAL